MDISKLSTDEQTLLIAALRAFHCQVADHANEFDRAYGPTDGRARDAWRNAQATQKQIRELGVKLGLPV